MIRIRRAEPADAVSLVELAEAVGGEEGRWILATDTWRSVSEERRYLKTVLRHPDATVIVALDGEQVVGRLSLSRDPHPASHHVADLGLMVAESHRRRGIGKRLLEEAVTWARGVGIRKLELHVFPWNESALRLYESFGFEREGYRKRHYVRGDELVDAILMALEVPTGDARIHREDAPEQPVRQVAACPGVPHAEEEHEICEPHHHLVMTRFPGNYTSAPRKGTTSAPAGDGSPCAGSSPSASSRGVGGEPGRQRLDALLERAPDVVWSAVRRARHEPIPRRYDCTPTARSPSVPSTHAAR